MAVLLLQDLHVAIEQKRILQGVSLELHTGEHVSVLGPGGCGKSTLLKTIIGLITPSSGHIELFGKKFADADDSERSSMLKKIGMAFQQGALFDFMTVRENILFSMENMTQMSRLEMEERVVKMLAQVNLPNAAHKLPSELSGGMRRRVGVVRALCSSPLLALIDEPTAGLDPVTSTIVIDLVLRLAESTGSTILCVTSNVDVAFRFAKKVAILNEGKIVGFGTWDELTQGGNAWINHFLNVRGNHFAKN
jgi:phospholipid/cholesterol/gamma-HCH transport system ATP-binding protein